MIKKFKRIYGGSIRFTLALMLPLLNVIVNAVAFSVQDIHVGYLTLNISYPPIILLTLLFGLALSKFVLKVKDKKNEKYRRSVVVLYLFLVLFSLLPNPTAHISGDIPIFFVPFFAAYVVHLADNLDKFKF